MVTQQSLRKNALRKHALLSEQRSRVAALKCELEALEQSVTVSKSEELDAFQLLAKAECNQLCNRVMTHLPREIRDMVYFHLSTSPSERITREYFRSTLDPITRTYSYDPVRWRSNYHPEHFWDTEYVGSNFFCELVENHYRTSTFIFGHDNGLIQRFLEADHFQTSYLLTDLVSKIEVHLNAMTFDRNTCVGYMFGCATKPERFAAAMQGVEGLKSGASVVVRFNTQAKDEEQKEDQIMTACTALIPKLGDLRVRGYKVGMVINRSEEVELDNETGDYELKQLRRRGPCATGSDCSMDEQR